MKMNKYSAKKTIFNLITDITHSKTKSALYAALRQNRPKKGLLWGDAI
jgi:hypothetical protein